MSFEVTLTDYEKDYARYIGDRRNEEANKAGRKPAYGFQGNNLDAWKIHCDGAAGEIAVAKFLNIYYDGSVNTYKIGGDVGTFQVRTRSVPAELYVREDDDLERKFILVIGTLPNPIFTIVGWIKGTDAVRKEWLRDYDNRTDAYFVPSDHLHSMLILMEDLILNDSCRRIQRLRKQCAK